MTHLERYFHVYRGLSPCHLHNCRSLANQDHSILQVRIILKDAGDEINHARCADPAAATSAALPLSNDRVPTGKRAPDEQVMFATRLSSV